MKEGGQARRLTTASPPCGFTPAGLQIVGRPFDEAMLFRIGYAYERVTAWHRQRPSLAVAHAH